MNSRCIKHSIVAIVAVLALSVPAAGAKGKNLMYNAYFESAVEAFKKQKYVDCEKMARSAAEQIETEGDSSELCATLLLLGSALNQEGKNKEAEPVLKRCLKMAEDLGYNDDMMSGILDSLGFVYAAQGKVRDAIPLSEKALHMREKVGAKKPQVLKSNLNNLACLYLRAGNYRQAAPLFSRAITLYEKEPGFRNTDLAKTLNNYGLTEYHLGHFEESEKLQKRAIEVLKAGGAESTSEASAPTCNLGLIYLDQGKLDEAEKLFRDSLKLTETNLGPDCVQAAVDRRNIGYVLVKRGEYDKAEKYYREAIAIATKHLGKVNQDVLLGTAELGNCLRLQGKQEEAKKIVEDATRELREVVGNDHTYLAEASVHLAYIQRDDGHPEEAKTTYEEALKIIENASGTDNDRYKLFKAKEQDFTGEQVASRPAQVASSVSGAKVTSSNSNVSTGGAKVTAGGSNPSSTGTPIGTPTMTPQAASRPIGDKWALVIGISKFHDPDISLKYAAKDAKDFAQFLVKEQGFAPDHVKVLTDDQATRRNILAFIGDKWLPRVAGPDDLVVLYISSHGSSSQMDREGLNYIVAYNTDKDSLFATGIPLQTLTEMVKTRVHSDRVLLLLDACHSGTAEVASKNLLRYHNFDAEQIVQGTGQLVVCSSSPNELSWESKQYNNGVFTARLMEGLRKKGRDTTLAEAFNHMKDSVQQEVLHDRGQVQTPVFKALWHGADLKLGAKPTKPKSGIVADVSPYPEEAEDRPTAGTKPIPKKSAPKDAGLKRKS